MRNLVAILLLSFAFALPGAAQAADFPQTPYVPQVDYGLDGGWYIRGSKELSYDWAPDVENCACTGVTAQGWDYGFGVGFGYEFGNGLRLDKTYDYMYSTGETDTAEAYTLTTHLLLANGYVDFGLGNDYDASGGLMGYVGAGVGAAYYTLTAAGAVDNTAWTWAAAGMAGIGYDMGSSVIDVGYRLVYLNQLATGDVSPGLVNGVFSHQVRVSWRYRL